MQKLYPEKKECIIPSIGLPVYVPVNSFINGIFSLLTSTELMTSKNLLFTDCTNPCYVPENDQNRDYGDINMGNAYD